MKTNTNSIIKAWRLCSMIIFYSSVANPLFAKRDATADLTYTYVARNLYHFHCTYYRDCLAIPAPNFIIMNIASVTSGFNQNDTLTRIPGNAEVITYNCPASPSICDGGNQEGIEKYEYEAYITVHGRCPDWTFSIYDCCWSSAITTIQNPNASYAYAEARLNNMIYDNSSPQFTNDPIIYFIPQNQNFHYNNGMVDPDGDSLVYSLIPARSGPNTNLIYNLGYDFLNPVSSVPSTSFDQHTGDLFIHPNLNEIGVIAYLIEDFRNGVLVGSVMRNISLFVFPTTNGSPTLSGMDGSSQFVTAVFPGSPLCFNIFSDDPNANDLLSMMWNHSIQQSSLSVSSGLHPTGTFCWTPSLGDVRAQPYMFTVTIKDDFCPMNNAAVYSYSIYVTLDSTMVNAPSNIFSDRYLFFISPNPSTGIFTIQSAEKFSQLKIFNALGECILKKEFENRIDLSSQPKGIYFVEAITDTGKATRQKLLKE